MLVHTTSYSYVEFKLRANLWTNIIVIRNNVLLGDCAGFPYNKVVTKTLCLIVLDYDRFSRDDPIGEVCLPLGDLDLSSGQTMWKTLAPCKGSLVSSFLMYFS